MTQVQNFFRASIVIIMACALVGIGAEELHRKTRKIKVSDASGQRMMRILNPNSDFRKDGLAERTKREEEQAHERAQLKEEPVSSAETEHLDPTGLRKLLNKLLP